jgi:hypothetical protein
MDEWAIRARRSNRLKQVDVIHSGPRTQWIHRGQPMLAPEPQPEDVRQEHELLERQGFVKVVESSEGTTIAWSVFAPNWASLYYVMDWLGAASPPFILKYYLSGWFEETFPDATSARHRIQTIIGKSDIHLSRRTYVQTANPNRPDMPDILRESLGHGAPPDFSVDCIYDTASGKFNVERVGRKSEIARVWGLSPVSYPCISGHSYDQVVSAAYREVLTTGEPHYDHVCAAMMTPYADVLWYTYQRVILPSKFRGSKKGVVVVSKEAPVDIRVV